jgi:hypothetical protein
MMVYAMRPRPDNALAPTKNKGTAAVKLRNYVVFEVNSLLLRVTVFNRRPLRHGTHPSAHRTQR